LSRRNILEEDKLTSMLGEIAKRLQERETKIRRRFGLTEAEYRGILCLDEEEKITCQEFSKRLGLSESRGSRVVELLCADNYLERVDCDADRRCKNIWLTEKGKNVRRMIAEEIEFIEDGLIAGYPGAKLLLLKSDLRRLTQKL
jgi:DNA-binding MarR family transcriptional regulator